MTQREPRPADSGSRSAERPERGATPRHGDQGDRAPAPPPSGLPAALSVTVSREAGSRGNTIGTRAGQKLGWPVYNQELLEDVAQEGSFHQNVAAQFSGPTLRWVEERLQQLRAEGGLLEHPSMIQLARTMLALGAQGHVVLIGRGANCVLPPETTLSVRIVAPREDRIAYVSQWLRLSRDQAAEQVQLRDARRADYLAKHFHRQPDDIYQYDLLLNPSLLGEEACADLIVQAARAKAAAQQPADRATPPWMLETVM